MYKVISTISVSFFVFIGWIIYLANTVQKSIFFDLVARIPYGDKLGHFCLFGCLTLAANLLLKFRRVNFSNVPISNVPIYTGTVLVFLFVLIEELSQHFIPNRTLDGVDLIADIIGIILFNFLTILLANWVEKLTADKHKNQHVNTTSSTK